MRYKKRCKNKPYKVVQISFNTKKEYEKFHTNAVSFWKKDNHYADAQYIRECIKQNRKERPINTRRKAIAFVESQDYANKILLTSCDDRLNEALIGQAKESIDLWVF